MVPVILASSSPRRRELLARVGIAIDVIPAELDETPRAGEAPVDYARRVAAAKADAIAHGEPERWVLAADTVVAIGRDILGKPTDPDDAARMLSQLSGRTHCVVTAFCLRGPGGRRRDREVSTDVTFRTLSADEIADYVAAGEWVGKAGAYAVQGMAAAMVSEVRGSVTNVIGLPLAEVVDELTLAGAARVDYRNGAAV